MSRESNNTLIVVAGPTAVGKTDVAISLATTFDSEILSFDSRQFYKELNIGTAKPTREELEIVKHHFINSHSVQEDYSAGQFAEDALEKLDKLFDLHPMIIAVGGSGLYEKALVEGLDDMPDIPQKIRKELNEAFLANGLEFLLEELKEKDPVYYENVDRQNHARIIRALEVIRTTGNSFSSRRKNQKGKKRHFKVLKIGLDLPRLELYNRINQRVDDMIAHGLVDEAKRLHNWRGLNALETVGYKELFDHFEGEFDLKEAIRLIKRNSRRYAKRQLTWFRRDKEIHWFHPKQLPEIKALIEREAGISTS